MRFPVGETSIEIDGDTVRWVLPTATLTQPLALFLAEGPPAEVILPRFGWTDADGAPCSVLDALLSAVAPEVPSAERQWGWSVRRSHRLAGEASAALLSRVAARSGPVAATRALLDELRGGSSVPVSASALRIFARTQAFDLQEATRGLVDRALLRPGLNASAWEVAIALGVRRPVAAEVEQIRAAEGEAATDAARELLRRARREGVDALEALEPLHHHAAPSVPFFASYAARHAARLRGVALPPLAPPEGQPELGPSEAEDSTRQVECNWEAAAALRDGPSAEPHAPPRCRLGASDDVETTYYRNGSGTGWRDETLEGRCRECAAYTLVEISD